MLKDHKVRDYMTFPAITITPTTSLRAAKQMMREHNIRHLPVVRAEKLVGIVSSGDIRRASPSDATSLSIWELNYLWEQLTVERSMTANVITVQPDTSMTEAVRLMLENRVGCLPVVDSTGRLTGILTEVDMLRLLLELAQERADSTAELSSEDWAATSL